jgi:MAS20 protein import receptor
MTSLFLQLPKAYRVCPANPAYFMKHLQAGEALLAQGPSAFDAAAQCFFRALRVYALLTQLP